MLWTRPDLAHATLRLGPMVALTLLAGSAEAQTVVRTEPIDNYTPLMGATPLATPTSDDNEYTVDSPFPIWFYGQSYTSFRVGDNGAILFPAADQNISASNPTPGAATPNNFIAPLWDDLYVANNGALGWAVEGSVPSRRLTVEWRNVSRCCTEGNADATFRVIFFEGPVMNLNVEYGALTPNTSSFSATMAMEDEAGANVIPFTPTDCGASCGDVDVSQMSNMRVLVTDDPGPDLSAISVIAPEFLVTGQTGDIAVTLRNLHANPLGPFDILVEGSLSADFTSPVALGTTAGVTASPFATATVVVPSESPTGVGPAPLYVRATLDAAAAINEVDEANNTVSAPSTAQVLAATPDLAVEAIGVVSPTVDAGASVDVDTTIRNIGTAAANNVTVRIVLSSNPVISPQDPTLAERTISLAPDATDIATTAVTVPTNIETGAYYLGVLVDPAGELAELSEVNNASATAATIDVVGDALAIVTAALPQGFLQVPYSAALRAVGGAVTWSVVDGQLPEGLFLNPTNGEISGRPSRIESATPTFRAAANGQTTDIMLTMSIVDAAQPLAVATVALPPGVVGQEYVTPLTAAGGSATTATLTWSATELPPGLRIEPSGQVLGAPTVPGVRTVTLMVSDGIASATRMVPLDVRNSANLQISPIALAVAQLGQTYQTQLQASGGLTPYAWTRLSGELPPGITLDGAGALTGTPQRVGAFRFVVQAVDAAANVTPARDQNTFELVVRDDQGQFAIATTSLPAGVLGVSYTQSITTSGGEGPYLWTLEEGQLPDGLTSAADPTSGEFRISGLPTAVGTSNLLLAVTDTRGRVAERAFAIRVFETAPADGPTAIGGGGCVCRRRSGPSSMSALALMGLIGVFTLRRRTTRRAG